jgi:membrane protein YqaA with SNARE-associated domain
VILAVAALWGFAEATLFFVVPDVWLTAVAVRRGARAALAAALCAAAGALVGGALMYAWGADDPAGAAAALDAVPAVSPAMLDRVRADLERDGAAAALLAGAFSGVPYKAYAALAPSAGVGPWPLLAATAPARLARFVPACLLAALLSGVLSGRLSARGRTLVLAGFWAAFYAYYLGVTPG